MTLTNHQQAIINVLTPKITKVPIRLKHYNQITQTGNRKIKEFKNPITGAFIKNNWANRKRVFKQINDLNEKSTKRDEEINLIRERNKIENKTEIIDYSAITVFMGVEIKAKDIENIEDLYYYFNYLFRKTRHIGGFVLSSIRIYFVDEENHNRYRSISNAYFSDDDEETKNEFLMRIADFISGDNLNVGSDAIGNNSILNLENFRLHFLNVANVESNNNSIIFNNINVNNIEGYKKNNCLNNCIKYLNEFKNLKYDCVREIKNLCDLMSIIENNELPIKIISNVIEIKELKGVKVFKTMIDKNKKKFKQKVFKANECDFGIKELYKNTNFEIKHTLVFCPISEHIEVLTDNTTIILDNIYINDNNEVFKENEGVLNKIYKHNDIYEYNIKEKNKCRISYIFYDYETITDWKNNNINTEYSISWFEITEKSFHEYIEKLEDGDIEFKPKKGELNNVVGFDCSNKFLNWIHNNEDNKRFVFISFNGSNFDNLILVNKMLQDKRFIVKKPLYVGNSLLDAEINGRHNFYDLRRHLMGSLKKNCKDFNIPLKYCKIELEMGHTEIQNYYNTHTKEEFIKFMDNDELVRYNNNDVFSLAYLFIKYYNVFSSINGYEDIQKDFTNFRTISSIIYEIFSNNIKKSKIKLPKLSLKQYEDLQKFKTAGRVEIFGEKPIFLTDEEIVSMDVCSLYPYIMAIIDIYYPCGEIIETDTYINDKIGFYYCNIDQTMLKKNNLPNILPEKTKTENDWVSKNILCNYLISNTTIELLKSYENIGVKCEILNGFYFTDKIKGCQLFKPILNLMGLKNIQDGYKNLKDEQYNSSLRETLKLLMNALSGKVIEGIHLDQTIINNNSIEEMVKLYGKKESGKINDLCVIDCVDENLILSYKRNIEDLINKQRPIYLGCLIYENARKYMYDNIYSKIGLEKLLYTDTDCGKFRKVDFDNWAKWAKKTPVKHWEEIEQFDIRYKTHKLYNENSKVFGSFENELKNNNIFYALQKKFWLVANKKDGEIDYIKTRFKGINPNSLILPDTENNIVLRKYKKDGVFDIEENISIINDGEKVFSWIQNNYSNLVVGGDYDKYGKTKEDKGELCNQIQFFDNLYKNLSSNVLVNNFQKVVKNSKRGVKEGETEKYNKNTNSIMCRYMVKTIKI